MSEVSSKDSAKVSDISANKSDVGGAENAVIIGKIESDSRRWKISDVTSDDTVTKHYSTESDNRRWKRDAMSEESNSKHSSSSREIRNDQQGERTHSASRYERGDKGRDIGAGRRSSSRGNSWNWKSGPSGNLKSRKEEPIPRRGFSRGHGPPVHYKGDEQPYQRSRLTNSSSTSNLNSRNTGMINEPERKFSKDNLKDASRTQTEDPIFKLLKRIVRPSIEKEKRVASAKQLKELLGEANTISLSSSKVFELIDSLQNVLFERGMKDVKQEIAMCIGILGNLLDHDRHRFLDWIYSNTNSSDEEIKIYACMALLEMLKQDSVVQNSANFIANVLANMHNILEAASSPNLLSAIMDVILVIAQVYPHIFSPCFREVIDIVIGWLIDPSQGEFLQDCMSRFVVNLQPFWTSEIDFSAILLGQFTEDLEIMLEQDLSQALHGQSEASVKAITDKIIALLRVFYLVMLSLGDSISSHRGGTISLEYLAQLLTKLVTGLSPIVHEGRVDMIVILSNDSLRLLLNQLNPESATRCGDIVLPFLIGQTIGKVRPLSSSGTVSMIRLLQKVIELWSTQLPVYFLYQLLGPDSLLLSFRFSLCPQINTELMMFYHNVMALKSVPLLEEAYRLVLGDLDKSFNVLLDGSSQPCLQLVTGENAFANMTYSKRQAQHVICFNIGALTEIANTKSNLIGMWALSPSIFTLLYHHLMITSPWLNQHYPSVVYAILYAFHSQCHRHSNFMSSSTLVTPLDQAGGSRLASLSQATSHNLTHILVTIHQLLDLPDTAFDSRCLLMKWCADILSSLTTSSHVYSSLEVIDLMTSLISQGYHKEQQILQCCAQCLKIAFKTTTQFTDSIMKKMSDLCLYRLTDSRKSIREAFMSALKVLPLDFIMKTSVFEAQDEWMFTENKGKSVGLSSAWHARRSHMARLPAGTFHSHNFRHTMAYILNGSSPSQTGSFHWLEAMFHTRQRINKPHSGTAAGVSFTDVMDNNESYLWFWATWECAQFAVMSRLRTPLGKPPETFVAIETVIKGFAAEAHSFDQSEEDLSGREMSKAEKPGEFISLNRVRLLLDFMGHLDKLLYNAYEGCSVAMPGAHKVVKTFFRTNRNTCQEWLSRIRMPLLTIAIHCGKPAIAVRQAFELLRDLDENGNSEGPVFDQAIMYLIKALCQLNSPESIIGVYHWCKEITGKSVDWILAVAEMAYQRFEKATRELQKIVIDSQNGMDEHSKESADESISSSDDSDTEDNCDDERERAPKARSRHHAKRKGKDDLSISTPVMEFLSHQACESYMQLNNWDAILEWQSWMSQQHPASDDGRTIGNLKPIVDNNYIRALQQFDTGNLKEVKDSLELIPGFNTMNGMRPEVTGVCWDFTKASAICRRSVLQGATELLEDGESTSKMDLMRLLQQSERQGEGLVKVAASDWPPVIYPNVLADLSSLLALKKHADGIFSMVPLSSSVMARQNTNINVYHQLMRSVKTIKQLRGDSLKDELDTQLSCLRLGTANLSRKNNNLTIAEHLLLEETSVCLGAPASRPSSLSSALADIRKLPVQSVHVVNLQREGAKHLRASGKIRSAMETLLGSIITSSLNLPESSRTLKDGRKLTELGARSLLNIVKWLQSDPKFLTSLSGAVSAFTSSNSGSSQIMSLLSQLFAAENNSISQGRSPLLMTGRGLWDSPNVPETDGILGTLLHLSAMQSPDLAKAWFNLASWCYKWGRKAVDNASNGYTELCQEEKSQILAILPSNLKEDEKEMVLSILSRVHNLESGEEDIIDQDQSLYDDGTETTRKQLLSCCQSLSQLPICSVERLLGIWRGVVKRLYHFYHLSAQAYFTYLQVKTSNEIEDGESGTVVSTLRLLRLLVKHAWELREVLELGLSQTPTQPWKGIIPQLFSRLSHPESYVRHSISELLCRIGLQSPHLILYPAVVGSTNKLQIKLPGRKGFMTRVSDPGDEDDGDHENEDTDDVDEGSSPELQACLSSLVESLSNRDSRMVRQVQLMVQELRRVTLLWEELWLGTLTQHQGDVQRRLVQLEAEVRRVEANKSLSRSTKLAVIKEKHRTIMKPILVTVRHLHEITSQTPQTPQEIWFQSAYGQQINAALRRLEDPPDPASPHDSWSLFKNIQQSLQSRAQKRSSFQLKMGDISPSLASLTQSVIPMPGQSMSDQVVTIEGVHDIAQILPTKTKPKKLIFIGSDGKRHPYLFKGLEDLHLDERIMQFLSIVNTMLYSPKRDRGRQPLYRARHYSVTPLGSRSGLIQWVQGSTPLFSLYKKWQHREAIAATLKASSAQGTGTSANIPSLPRPSEVFYSKLNPALKEKGLEGVDNRKDWPLNVLRNVLDDLMDETPDDLLAKELWCCSSSAGEWWQMTQVYARSTAVISVIGYIIGLGDRHLDNVLIDLGTGEVVHIDYNVCFEKGKGLRVPEKVPFRMTANIETALGLTGVEGTFRLAAEHVLKTMRKGREPLLTLLEAFVYDPLVDWTTGMDAGYTGAFYGGEMGGAGSRTGAVGKMKMEKDMTTSMFSIRLTEMEAAWFTNKSELCSSLPVLRDTVETWQKSYEAMELKEKELEDMKDVSVCLSDALGNPKHSIFSLSDRYWDYSLLQSARCQVIRSVEEKIIEYSNWHKMHTMALKRLSGIDFNTLRSKVSSLPNMGLPSFASASAFLQGAGQSQVLVQCDELEAEMSSLLEQRRSVLHEILTILHTYSSVVAQLGSEFAADNRMHKFMGWLGDMLSDFTLSKCEETVSFFRKVYSSEQELQVSRAQTVFNTEVKLKALIRDTDTKTCKLHERRNQDLSDTSVLEVQVKEATRALHLFIYENKGEGEMSLVCVIVSALYTLNKRYLLMEGAASGAGDRLMDLTSRDGDWFLDELCSMSANVNQFLNTLIAYTQACEHGRTKALRACMKATDSVYTTLQDLNMSFRSIIIPEAINLLQAQDPQLLSILSQLEAMIGSCSLTLDEMVKELEVCHRNAIMGIHKEGHSEILEEVKHLQEEFMLLTQGEQDPTSGQLAPGQMLLMGLNGLFTHLELEFSSLIEAWDVLDVPSTWTKVDTVRDARSLQLSSFNAITRPLLPAIFFVKRVQAFHMFFLLASQFVMSMQGEDGANVYDDERLAKPIKRFVADFVRKQVLGFPSQILGYLLCMFLEFMGVNVTAEIELKDIGAECKVPLDSLCKKGMDICLGKGHFQHSHLSQVSSLTTNLDTAWRKLDLAKRLDSHVLLLENQLQRHQTQLTRMQWVHCDLYTQAKRSASTMVEPHRAIVLSGMKKVVQTLLANESEVSQCLERYNQMETNIGQRLRWAAGANPTLHAVISEFEGAISFRNTFIHEENQRVEEATSLSQAILQLEAMRTQTSEAVAADSDFQQLVTQCMDVCKMPENPQSCVSDVELNLLRLKPLNERDKSDQKWIEGAVREVSKFMEIGEKEAGEAHLELVTLQNDIQDVVRAIKTLLSSHHTLMSDIRSILKTMAKLEEQDKGEEVSEDGVRAYLAHYKTFSEDITSVMKTVVAEEVTKEEMEKSLLKLDDVNGKIDLVYDSLSALAPSILDAAAATTDCDHAANGAGDNQKTAGAQKDRDSPPPNSAAWKAKKEKEKVSRDPKTGKAVQERNSYAVGVWRRVKMKLEGRDTDINKRMPVSEQIDMIVKEAKNLDNLAVLYEGWTPWV